MEGTTEGVDTEYRQYRHCNLGESATAGQKTMQIVTKKNKSSTAVRTGTCIKPTHGWQHIECNFLKNKYGDNKQTEKGV